MKIDPNKFIDLSKKSVMPVFNENSFVFNMTTKDYVEGKTMVTFEIWLNLILVCKHTVDIGRYLG